MDTIILKTAIDYIHSLGRFTGRPGLHRIRALCAALGNPQDGLRFVHIAGTNGKGSTACMTASVLQAAGYRVGLYTSPYLVQFHERIRVNGALISDGDLTRLSGEVAAAAKGLSLPAGETIGEFEFTTALAFRYFAEQGVAIKVISGDNPVTVSQVALEAGIADAAKYIDMSTLHTEDDIREAATQYTVFGRVTPVQKRQLVHALQSAGHTVGMTGDGVNDVLALKDADCSVAMASGCDAAAQVSQLVLLESDFAAMPSVVMEGRRVVNNIERSASLFLVKNIFSFLMAVFSVCFRSTYPLEPSQVSLISMFTIGIPGFFLALQPNGDIIHGRFLSNVLIKALPAGLTDFLVVGALVVFGSVFGVNETDISTACTMLLAIVGFMILYHISKPLNPLRWCVWVGCIVGLLVCSIWLGDVFGIEHMSMECVMLFVLFAIVTEPTLRYGTILVEKIGGIITNRTK